MATQATPNSLTRQRSAREALWLVDTCVAKKKRTILQFAEEEIVLPNGPFAGRKFRADRQPFAKLLFDAIDAGEFGRVNVTGPTQTGKTLIGFVIIILYYLFEMRETVLCGVPHLDMAGDKWAEDILPVLLRTRYADQLPKNGVGSRGGKVTSIRFRNGATLRFMSGRGGDKARAGFTSRIMVVTETDGMDEASSTSREADPITQMQGRLRAHGSRKRIFLECTVSVESGRTWQEHLAGTTSRIYLQCPYCLHHVHPGRANLKGWDAAENIIDAGQLSAFHCPDCDHPWTEADRRWANERACLVHRGQTINPKSGKVTGEPAKTDTLSFRWDAANNLFLTAADIGQDEWRARRARDRENAEKEMCQFVWAMPYADPEIEEIPLTIDQVQRRTERLPRGILPDDTIYLSAGLDIGKRHCHWVVLANRTNQRGYVVAYGEIRPESDRLGTDKALRAAFDSFRSMALQGWAKQSGVLVPVLQCFIDSSWYSDTVYAWCRDAREEGRDRFRPAKGYGMLQRRDKFYREPDRKGKGSAVQFVGRGYHLSRIAAQQVALVHINADTWKSTVRERFALEDPEQPGACVLFHAEPHEHLEFAEHLLSEEPREVYDPDRGGKVIVWRRVSRNNHYLDAMALAMVAADYIEAQQESAHPAPMVAIPGQGEVHVEWRSKAVRR